MISMSSGTWTVALLSIVIFLTMVVAASSAAAEDVEIDREISVSEESDSFHAVSDSQGFKLNDRFDLIFDEGTLSLWYTENTSASDPPSWEFEISFERLFTFMDDGSGRFDGGDTVVNSLDMSDTSYSLAYSTAPLPNSGHKTMITAASEEGILTLGFVITTSPTVVGEVAISPSDVKLDIRISGLELSGEADHIGLGMSVDADTESTVELEGLDGSEQLNLTQSSLGGFFRWADNASVDDVQQSVGATWLDETLTLSYPVGQLIVHDPVIGIRSMAPLSGPLAALKPIGEPLLYGVGLALATAAVLGAVAIRIRKNH